MNASPKKTLQLLLFAVLASVLVMAGCSSKGGNAGTASPQPESPAAGSASDSGGQAASASPTPEPAPEPQEPIKLTTLHPYWGEMPDVDGPVFKRLEEIMNADITPTFFHGPNMLDKVNVALASGDLPDILVVFQGKQPSIVNAIRSGAFWELSDYIGQYPNLQATRDPIRDENIKVDGKVWALYVNDEISKTGITLRQDWLDRLGLAQPKTLDELYNVLRAFAKDDPDGNGKNDTLGLATYLVNNAVAGADVIQAKLGAPSVYGLDNGKLTPAFMTPQYREALKFYRKLYAEGIMNQDFAYAQRNQVEQMYQKGTVGGYTGNVDTPFWAELFKVAPDAKLVSFSDLEGPNLQYAGLGYWVTMMFPKSTVKTEERLHEILAALDRIAAPENQEFRLYGVEGFNYKLEDGKHVFLEGNNPTAYMNSINALASVPFDKSFEGLPAWLEQAERLVDKNAESPNLTRNPVTAVISDTFTEVGSELMKLVSDAEVKYIIGEIDDAGFDKMIEQWKSTGGSKVIAEYEAALAK